MKLLDHPQYHRIIIAAAPFCLKCAAVAVAIVIIIISLVTSGYPYCDRWSRR